MEQLSNHSCKSIRKRKKHIWSIASFQGVICSYSLFISRLFVLAYVIDTGAANNKAGTKNSRKYFLPRREIENYNLLIDGRNLYDEPINDLIKQYDEVRKYQEDKVMIILNNIY